MMDIGVTLAQLQKRIDRLERASRLSYASLDDAALEVRDGGGSLRGIVGQQGDGTTAVNVVNGPPPPAPASPIVVSVLSGVTVSWDGTFAGGAVMPLDWSRVEVHASTTAIYTPAAATLKATVETAQGCTVVIATPDPVYVQLVARSTSGTASTPSTTVGPVGPTAVVASDMVDGIVTTVKIADDAVTQAKVAVGAIGTTEINDNAITTPKIVAGAVQTAQLDALAVNASKIAAGAVTTAKLDALAVTANELAANAVTASKILAGSVDATALKADAITGKTITGGTITGTDIIGGTVTGGIVRTGSTGERVVMTPTPPLPLAQRPSVLFYSGATDEIGPGVLNSGVTTGQPSTILASQATATDSLGRAIRTTLGLIPPKPGAYGGRFLATTLNPSGSTTAGRVLIDGLSATDADGQAVLSLYTEDGATTPKTAEVRLGGGQAKVFADALQVMPTATANSGIFLNSAAGHTGNMIRLQHDAVDEFVVDNAGNATITGILAAGNIAWGTINVTTTAANLPASAIVTGLNVKGSSFRAYVTASSAVPGTGVLGVSANNVTSAGATVYITRNAAATTGVYWLIIGI